MFELMKNKSKYSTYLKRGLAIMWRVAASLSLGLILYITVIILLLLNGTNKHITPNYLLAKLERGMTFEDCAEDLYMWSERKQKGNWRYRLVNPGIAGYTSQAKYVYLVFEEDRLVAIDVGTRTGFKYTVTTIPLPEVEE